MSLRRNLHAYVPVPRLHTLRLVAPPPRPPAAPAAPAQPPAARLVARGILSAGAFRAAVLAALARRDEPLTLTEVLHALRYPRVLRAAVQAQLYELVAEGAIERPRPGLYQRPRP